MIDALKALYIIGIIICGAMAIVHEDIRCILISPVWPLFYLRYIFTLLRGEK